MLYLEKKNMKISISNNKILIFKNRKPTLLLSMVATTIWLCVLITYIPQFMPLYMNSYRIDV